MSEQTPASAPTPTGPPTPAPPPSIWGKDAQVEVLQETTSVDQDGKVRQFATCNIYVMVAQPTPAPLTDGSQPETPAPVKQVLQQFTVELAVETAAQPRVLARLQSHEAAAKASQGIA